MHHRIAIATLLLVLACGEGDEDRTSSSSAGGATSSSTSSSTAGSGAAGTGGAAEGASVACPPSQTPCDTGEYCCVPIIASPTSCESDEAACDANFSILKFCDGPEDCARGVCCYSQTGSDAAPEAGRVECASSCSGSNQKVVCDPGDPASCSSGQRCNTVGTPMPLCE